MFFAWFESTELFTDFDVSAPLFSFVENDNVLHTTVTCSLCTTVEGFKRYSFNDAKSKQQCFECALKLKVDWGGGFENFSDLKTVFEKFSILDSFNERTFESIEEKFIVLFDVAALYQKLFTVIENVHSPERLGLSRAAYEYFKPFFMSFINKFESIFVQAGKDENLFNLFQRIVASKYVGKSSDFEPETLLEYAVSSDVFEMMKVKNTFIFTKAFCDAHHVLTKYNPFTVLLLLSKNFHLNFVEVLTVEELIFIYDADFFKEVKRSQDTRRKAHLENNFLIIEKLPVDVLEVMKSLGESSQDLTVKEIFEISNTI